jgi:CheY-like chemotaxis protein
MLMQVEIGQALVVDDELHNREFAAKLLERAGFQVIQAVSGEDAIDLAHTLHNLTLAVIDMEMPNMNGLELIRYMRQHYPDVMLIMATVYDDVSLIERAFRAGTDIFMVKPNGFIELYKHLSASRVDDAFLQNQWIADAGGLRPYRGKAAVAASW